MKSRTAQWLKAAFMAPLLAMYATNGCTADTIRYAASELENVANDMDGRSDDPDFGDYLADLIEDF